MDAVGAQRCAECGEDPPPGEHAVRVEHGVLIPCGLAPSDSDYGAERHFPERCISVESDGGGAGGGR